MWASMSSCSAVIAPYGRLDAHHLAGAALALAVDAVVQPEHPEHVLGQVAGQVALELTLELGDVGCALGVDLSLQHRGLTGAGDRPASPPGRWEMPTDSVRNDCTPFLIRQLRNRRAIPPAAPSWSNRAPGAVRSDRSATEQIGDPEGQVERLAGVEAGVAHRLVAGAQVGVEDVLGPAEALGDVVAGELDVHAAGPGAAAAVGVEEAR